MLSVPKKMNSKFAPPLFIRAPLCLELKEKIRPLRLLLSRRRRTSTEDEVMSEMPTNEVDSEPRRSARVIKLKWNWEDEQNQDEDPKLPGEIPNKKFSSSRGGKRLRN